MAPLLPHILLYISKAAERHTFMKYALAHDFLDHDMVFWPINVYNTHLVLLVTYPKLKTKKRDIFRLNSFSYGCQTNFSTYFSVH